MAAARKKSTPPVFVLQGEDTFVLDNLVRLAVERKGGPELCEVHRFNAALEETSEAVEIARSPSLLSPSSVVVLTNLESAKTDALEKLASYLKHPIPEVMLFLQYTPSNKVKTALTEILAGLPSTTPDKEKQKNFSRALQEIQSEFNITIDKQALAYLEHAAANQSEVGKADLEKLALYTGKGGKLTLSDCRRLIPDKTEQTIWKIGYAISDRKPDAALKVLHDLLDQGEEPIVLVGVVLYPLLRQMWLIKQAEIRGYPREKWSEVTQLQYFIIKNMADPTTKMSLKAIERGMQLLARADGELKGGSQWKEFTLERLAIHLATLK